MSLSSYDPDPNASLLVGTWEPAFRSQRDVGLNVPINYVTVPAVSLKAACFSHNQYENNAMRRCFSNLLASGFRKYVVDIYWDAGRSVWSLCPVEIPESASPADDASIGTLRPITREPLSSAHIDGRDPLSPTVAASPTRVPFLGNALVENRQASSSFSGSKTSSSRPSGSLSMSVSSVTTSSTSGTASPTPIEFPIQDGDPLVEVGPYNCTATINFSFLNSILSEYLDNSSTTLDAVSSYLVLNVHVAAPYASPESPAQQPAAGDLPNDENLLSQFLSSNLSSYIYTPQMVRDDRVDLNSSWFNAAHDQLPLVGYYKTEIKAGDIAITQDGWPTEAFMEFKEFYRLIVSYGTIDPQMALYNISKDASTIFGPEEIRVLQTVALNPSGAVVEGCLFNPNITFITPETNSSWTFAPDSNFPDLGSAPNTSVPILSVANLTSCGISPFLNTSLSNATADVNPLPYLAFTHSTLWTWAPDQPTNTSNTDSDTEDRCAALYGGSNVGRWRTVDCNSKLHAACQSTMSPYDWTITSDSDSYSRASDLCPDNTTFSVPHTALENAHLLYVLGQSPSLDSFDDSGTPRVLLNLNSLDVANCWVVGINETCPYQNPKDEDRTREVVVPTVAAILVFVLAALTFFVKCAANRREDKRGRRRRGSSGWDYEGVPS